MTRAGDHFVGIRDAMPQPKSEIGDATSAVLDGRTLPLFETKWMQAQGRSHPEHELWMLLVFASSKVVRSELSLGAESAGRVSRWFERIILPELDPNDLRPRRFDSEPQNEGAFDVPVIRKQSA